MRDLSSSSPHDAAALAAATFAAALTTFAEPGPYDLFSFVIGITLLLVLWAYERNRSRDTLQSIALGAVAGFVSLMILGPVLEYVLGGFSLKGKCVGVGEGGQCGPGEYDTNVDDLWLVAAWFLVGVFVSLWDNSIQEKNRNAKRDMVHLRC
jgi:hypothetical protein